MRRRRRRRWRRRRRRRRKKTIIMMKMKMMMMKTMDSPSLVICAVTIKIAGPYYKTMQPLRHIHQMNENDI